MRLSQKPYPEPVPITASIDAGAERFLADTVPHEAYCFPMSIAELPIRIDREKIAEFCRARGIRRLSLFGSVLRDDFDPARSDVDVLAEFEPGALSGVGFRYFGYGETLTAIFGRKVDFCSRLNKHIEEAVRREAIPIYDRSRYVEQLEYRIE